MRRHNSLKKTSGPLQQYDDPMRRVDPFQQYPDVFKQIIDWSKDPMVRPENQNKYFFSDGKTYYEQICKMLKLMSVFKEAFQQIYDNEDEIHEAWNNFVDNLTATAEYGEEVAVSLTWTDDSVNFDFTIPGGEDGVGIQSIVFNVDYTMTITLTDGTTYTSPSLRGETGATGPAGPQGPTGPQGPQGEGLNILDVYPTLADLQQAHPTGSPGDAYEVGSAPTYILYIWSSSQNAWVSAGSLGSVAPSNTNPLMDGTASAGISDLYSRGDHVHPTDTSRASQSDLNTVSGNLTTLSGQVSGIADAVDIVEDMIDDLSDIVHVSQNLSDQQFLYRESLADHDTIGRLDSIKGNTLVWNQLVQNGNFADTSGWAPSRGSLTASSNVLTYTITAIGASDNQNRIARPINIPVGHITITKVEVYCPRATPFLIQFRCNSSQVGSLTINVPANQWTEISFLRNNPTNLQYACDSIWLCANVMSGYSLNETIKFRNAMCVDLTALNSSAITDLNSLKQFFPLPYYGYTTGKLLPFLGEELKTTGKNLFDGQFELGNISVVDGSLADATDRIRTKNFTKVLPNTTYTFKDYPTSALTYTNIIGYKADYSGITDGTFNPSWGATIIGANTSGQTELSFTTTSQTQYIKVVVLGTTDISLKTQVESGSASSYEPYTSSTINLPTLTYFPTGMKDVPDNTNGGRIYDELTPNKATPRVGSVDLGPLDWSLSTVSSSQHIFRALLNDLNIKIPDNYSYPNATIADYQSYPYTPLSGSGDGYFAIGQRPEGKILVIIDFDYSTLESFISHISGKYLYYELETPTEQSISPALDMAFKAWKGGTEQILPENTSDPYTAPIRTDMTYMSTDEAVLYLKDHAVTDPTVIDDIEELQDDVGDLQTDVDTLQTQIGSESTTPMTGILGRLNTAETDITALENIIDSYYSIQTYTFIPDTIPYPAGSQTAKNVNAVTVPGYRPIGVIGWDFYNLSSDTPPQRLNASYMALERAYYLHSTGRIYVTFANNANYAQTNPRLDLYVLYMKVNGGN